MYASHYNNLCPHPHDVTRHWAPLEVKVSLHIHVIFTSWLRSKPLASEANIYRASHKSIICTITIAVGW